DAGVGELCQPGRDQDRVVLQTRPRVRDWVGSGFANAANSRRGIAGKYQMVLDDGDFAGRRHDRIEIGVSRTAIELGQLAAAEFEWHAQFNHGQHTTDPCLHADAFETHAFHAVLRWRYDGVAAAGADAGRLPAERTFEIDELPPGQHGRQRLFHIG